MNALAVIWAPVRTLASVAEERRVLLGFIVTALYAALSIVSGAIAFFGFFSQATFGPAGAGLPPEFEGFFTFAIVLGLIFALVMPFVYWLLVSGLMHLVTRFFGGTGPFSGTLAVVGVAQVPLVILGIAQLPITGLQIALLPEDFGAADPAAGNPAFGSPVATAVSLLSSALGMAAFLWFAVLVVIGASFARRVGYGESTGSCAISCAGCTGLILIVTVVVVVVIFAVVGAAGGAS